jgi:PEP-CTERM motif
MKRCQATIFFLLFCCLLFSASVPVCYGGGPYSGTTAGTFGLASKTGQYIDWRTAPYFFQDNNAADAVVAGENSNMLSWGNPVAPSGPSFVLFNGIGGPGFGPVADGAAFRIGTFTYFNGTINFLTGAYGAPFTITANDPVNNPIAPLVSSYTNIDTKNYVDNRPVPFWAVPFVPAAWNNGILISADGMSLPDFGKLALVAEGKNVTFDLLGKIVGDPMMIAYDIVVDPISIDDGAVIPLADETMLEPEPSSLLLSVLGVVGLCGLGWRQRKRLA